jgi:hypothetical protein
MHQDTAVHCWQQHTDSTGVGIRSASAAVLGILVQCKQGLANRHGDQPQLHEYQTPLQTHPMPEHPYHLQRTAPDWYDGLQSLCVIIVLASASPP